MLPLVARIPALDEAVSMYVLAQDDDYERKWAKARVDGRKGDNAVPIQYRDSRALDRCADLLMHEYLTWSHADKLSIVEDPILSVSQTRLRQRREMTLEDVYTGKGDQTIGRTRGSTDGIKRRIYDYMTPERDMALVPTAHLDLYNALANAGLTDRQREAIDLVYFGGMTQEDAAGEMGIHRANVNLYLRHAYDKIRQGMGE